MEKSRQLGIDLLGKGGAGMWRAACDCSIQPSCRDTALGHHHAGKAREGAQGPPLALHAQAVPSLAASSVPPSLTLQKGGGGRQLAEDGGRGSKAKLELGRPVRGRDRKPLRQTHCWPPRQTLGAETSQGCATIPGSRAAALSPAASQGKGCRWGGEVKSLGWV